MLTLQLCGRIVTASVSLCPGTSSNVSSCDIGVALVSGASNSTIMLSRSTSQLRAWAWNASAQSPVPVGPSQVTYNDIYSEIEVRWVSRQQSIVILTATVPSDCILAILQGLWMVWKLQAEFSVVGSALSRAQLRTTVETGVWSLPLPGPFPWDFIAPTIQLNYLYSLPGTVTLQRLHVTAFTEDTDPPTAILSTRTPLVPYHVNSLQPFFVAFTEPVQPIFDAAMLMMSNCTATSFVWISPRLLQFSVQSSVSEGFLRVDVSSVPLTDLAGNVGLSQPGISSLTVYYDVVPPVPRIHSTIPLFTNASTLQAHSWNLSVMLSEPSVTFHATSLSVTPPGAAIIDHFARVPIGDGGRLQYNFQVHPIRAGLVNISVSSGSFTDLANNANIEPASVWFYFDDEPPAVQLASLPAYSNTSSATLTVTLSESVINFNSTAIRVTGGTVASVAAVSSSPGAWPGQGTVVYELQLTLQVEGTVLVCVDVGAVVDFAGNENTAAACTSTLHDTVPPTASILSTVDLHAPNNFVAPMTIVLSEPVVAINSTCLVCTNCTVTSFARRNNSATHFDLTILPSVPEGLIAISMMDGAVADAAGNGLVGFQSLLFSWDIVPPTCVIYSNTSSPCNQYQVQPFYLHCSEEVFGLTDADFDVILTTVSDVQAVPGGTTDGTLFSLALHPYPSSRYPTITVTVSIVLRIHAITDRAGNLNAITSRITADGPPQPYTFRFYWDYGPKARPPAFNYTPIIVVVVLVVVSLVAGICIAYQRRRVRWKIRAVAGSAPAATSREPSQTEPYDDDVSPYDTEQNEETDGRSQTTSRSRSEFSPPVTQRNSPRTVAVVDDATTESQLNPLDHIAGRGDHYGDHSSHVKSHVNMPPLSPSAAGFQPEQAQANAGAALVSEATRDLIAKVPLRRAVLDPLPPARSASMSGEPLAPLHIASPVRSTSIAKLAPLLRSSSIDEHDGGSPQGYPGSEAASTMRHRGSVLSVNHGSPLHFESRPRGASSVQLTMPGSPSPSFDGKADEDPQELSRNPFAALIRKNSAVSSSFVTDTAAAADQPRATGRKNSASALPTVASRYRLTTNPKQFRDSLTRSPIGRERSNSTQGYAADSKKAAHGHQ